ncbi:MAG: EAL domain-containing protein [Xanthomonadales bacterium]|nr:EAL domain-containing protein [Xanthomonadales bacterium]
MARQSAITRVFGSLRGQTLLSVLGIHALIIPLFFTGLVFFVKQALTQQFVNEIRSEARLLAMMTNDAENEAELDALFFEAQLSGELLYTAVADATGAVIWEMRDALLGSRDPEFREDFFFGQHGDDVYFISTGLSAESGLARQLRLGFDERPTVNQIHALYLRAGLLTLGYLVLTLFLAGLWFDRLDRPIRELRAQSRRVATGEVRDPIDVRTGLLELRDLADDINHMRDELLKKTDSMEHLAMHDALTGLPNRALLMDRLQQSLKKAQRVDSPLALLLMDLDHFKEINDTLGHNVGDQVLRMLPERLQPCLRETDTMARLGGDEFAFLLPDCDMVDAAHVVHRLSDAMRKPFQLEGQNLHLGLSIGVALYPDHGKEPDTLLRQVDIAMYSAKSNKREYVLYSPDIDPHSKDRLALASELRRDIETGRIEVHFQPQIRVSERTLCAVEALCRWRHNGDYVPTEQFIPMADRLGLSDLLCREVVHQSLEAFSGHSIFDGLQLCLNLSVNNLRDADLPKLLLDELKLFGVAPESVVLEITEHEYMAEPGEALRRLKQFRQMGFGIAIDDFGTGHSSFSYLKNLPATEVKIDKSFVTHMARDHHDYALVAAVIALGQKLGLCVVAEGVEDVECLDQLDELGCDRAQGFYLSEARGVDDLQRWISDYEKPALRKTVPKA